MNHPTPVISSHLTSSLHKEPTPHNPTFHQDPVNCLAVQHPDCSYSTVKHECIATYQVMFFPIQSFTLKNMVQVDLQTKH